MASELEYTVQLTERQLGIVTYAMGWLAVTNQIPAKEALDVIARMETAFNDPPRSDD